MNKDINLGSGKGFEVDVFVPNLALAFEYNGEYHYKFVPLYHLRFSLRLPFIHYTPDVERRDQQKNQHCLKLGITLITIPYWWDEELSSLASTIRRARPDISMPSIRLTSPIPTAMPQQRYNSCTYFPSSVYWCSTLQSKTSDRPSW